MKMKRFKGNKRNIYRKPQSFESGHPSTKPGGTNSGNGEIA
jgi:hypothetical protein